VAFHRIHLPGHAVGASFARTRRDGETGACWRRALLRDPLAAALRCAVILAIGRLIAVQLEHATGAPVGAAALFRATEAALAAAR